MKKLSWNSFWMMALVLVYLVTSCAPIQSTGQAPPPDQNAVQAALQLTLTPATPTLVPTVPSSRCDKAQLIADVTVPPGTGMLPGQAFTKTWRLQNVGNCAWSTSYQVTFFSGDMMSAPPAFAFPQNVAVGQTIDVSVNMTAPTQTGTYVGNWMFKNANGALFGTGPDGNQPWLVEINVTGASATPGVTSSPPTVTGTPPTNTPDVITDQAVKLALELSPQFFRGFGIQINPNLAKGLDAARIGGQAGQLAGMIAPVVDENQSYHDRSNLVREVEGIFTISDPRLALETMIIYNKANIQYPLLPLGSYLLACYTPRANDCLAVSLQGQEFQINPGIIIITAEEQAPFPIVGYEEGSIRKCFRILGRKICIRVFR